MREGMNMEMPLIVAIEQNPFTGDLDFVWIDEVDGHKVRVPVALVKRDTDGGIFLEAA